MHLHSTFRCLAWRPVLYLMLLYAAVSGAQTALQVKGAMLPKLVGYVQWPSNAFASADAPLVFAVFGKHPFDRQFAAALTGNVARGRRVVLREIQSLDDATNCHVLFIPADHKDRATELIEATAGLPILTVADIQGFAEEGGIINFAVVSAKIRVEINRETALRAGLSIDARLLGVARLVTSQNNQTKGERP